MLKYIILKNYFNYSFIYINIYFVLSYNIYIYIYIYIDELIIYFN